MPASSSSNEDLPEMTSLQRPALVSGIGIILLCIVGGYAGIHLESLTSTSVDSLVTMGSFQLRATLLSFFLSGVIDLVVSYSLFLFFKPFAFDLSALAAIFRASYVAVLLGNMPTLNMVANLVDENPSLSQDDTVATIVSSALQTVNLSFNGTSLALFGIHLFLLGVICLVPTEHVDKPTLPKWLGVALLIAGVGYTADSIDRFLAPKPTLHLTASGCFVGELLLMIWLLVAGCKMEVKTSSRGKVELEHGLLAE